MEDNTTTNNTMPTTGINNDTPKTNINLANKPRKSKKKLIVPIIIILLLIIAAIIVAIIFTNKPKNSQSDSDKDNTPTVQSCDLHTTYENITSCISDDFLENGDLTSLYDNYKAAITASLSRNDQETVIKLIDSESKFLADRNRCGMVQELLNTTDTSSFSQTSLQEFYSNAAEISNYCEDTTSYEHWNTLYQQNITTEGA